MGSLRGVVWGRVGGLWTGTREDGAIEHSHITLLSAGLTLTLRGSALAVVLICTAQQ